MQTLGSPSLAAIERLPQFKAFHPEQRRELAKIANLVHYEHGEPVLREWKLANHLYVVVRGAVELTSKKALNPQIAQLREGDLFGWSAVVMPERYSTATARALTSTELLVFNRDELLALMERDHEVGYRLMTHVAHALAERFYMTLVKLMLPHEAAL